MSAILAQAISRKQYWPEREALMSQTWRAVRKSYFITSLLLLWPCKTLDYNVYNLLVRRKISSDLDVLFKDGSFKVLSYWRGINNKEVSSSSRSNIVKYNLYHTKIT